MVGRGGVRKHASFLVAGLLTRHCPATLLEGGCLGLT